MLNNAPMMRCSTSQNLAWVCDALQRNGWCQSVQRSADPFLPGQYLISGSPSLPVGMVNRGCAIARCSLACFEFMCNVNVGMCVYRIVIPCPGVTIGIHLSCSARPSWAHLLGGFHAGKRTRRVTGARVGLTPRSVSPFFSIFIIALRPLSIMYVLDGM